MFALAFALVKATLAKAAFNWRLLLALSIITFPASVLAEKTDTPNQHTPQKPLPVLINTLPSFETNTASTIAVEDLFRIELGNVFAGRLNAEIKHITCPPSRCLKMFRRQQADIIFMFAVTQERTQHLDFLQLHSFQHPIPFFVRKGESDRLKTYDDLLGLRVGVRRGSAHFEPFDGDERIHKVTVNSVDQLPKLLMADRIDAFVMFDPPTELELFETKIQISDYRPLAGARGIVAINKHSTWYAYREEINNIAQELTESGALSNMLTRYFRPSKLDTVFSPSSDSDTEPTPDNTQPRNAAPVNTNPTPTSSNHNTAKEP